MKNNGKSILKITVSIFTILMMLTLLSAGASAKCYTCSKDKTSLTVYKTHLGDGTPPATQQLTCCENTCIDYTAVAVSEDDSRVVKFKDLSKGRGRYIQWEFGDGEYSSEKNPVHKFPTKGYYITGLTIKCSDCGHLLWVHKTLIIK
jgi:PKD repeat protein